MNKINLLVIIVLAAGILVYVPGDVDASGQCYNNGYQQSACGVDIDESGHGGVELCEECFTCGYADGVCPEDYSDGSDEDRDYRMKIDMIHGIGDRHVESPDPETELMHNSGNDACNVISGDCEEVREYNHETEEWGSTSIACEENAVDNLEYEEDNHYKAVCDNVPKTPSCTSCPDPDCTTELSGLVFEEDEEEALEGATIGIGSISNEELDFYETETDEDGKYSFEVPRGNLTFQCGKDQYELQASKELLTRGDNVLDCNLEYAQCTSSCTQPNEYGEEICRASCQGEGGCYYDEAETVGSFEDIDNNKIEYNATEDCDGEVQGDFLRLGRINETHIKGLSCCQEGLETKYEPLFQVGGDVDTLITRSLRRTLDETGEDVSVNIIVFNE